MALATALVSVACASARADALVDPKNGNLVATWTDIELPPANGATVFLRRTYNSLSGRVGLFGGGWCSTLEDRVQEQADGTLVFRRCGAGNKVVFRPQPGGFLSAGGPDGGRAVRGVTGWVIHRGEGGIQEFDGEGRLRTARADGGHAMTIEWRADGRGPESVQYTSGAMLAFAYGETGGPSEVRAIAPGQPDGPVARYRYDASGVLVQVEAARGKARFDYCGERFKLCRVDINGKEEFRAEFTGDSGRVARLEAGGACPETFRYPTNAGRSFTVVRDRCGLIERYSFAYGDLLAPVLKRSTIRSPGRQVRVFYHPEHQLPERVWTREQDGGVSEQRYRFDRQGRIVFRWQDGSVNRVAYHEACNRMAWVETAEGQTRYAYDGQCHLRRIVRPDGEELALTYDTLGHIASMHHGERVVTITYDPKFGRPIRMTAPGMGAVEVIFRPDGTVEKVDSSDGPDAAMRISSLVNELSQAMQPSADIAQALCRNNALWVKCGEGNDTPVFASSGTGE